MGLLTRRISPLELGRNWGLVYVGNLAGALKESYPPESPPSFQR